MFIAVSLGATESMAEQDRPETESASEVRHRTANTLQLLATLARMRGQRATDAEVRRNMVWMAESIGALGGLERQRSTAGVDFAAYLTEMAPVWRRRRVGADIQVEVDADELRVRDQAASTLALVTSELVANALTHGLATAAAPSLRISLRPDGEGHVLLAVSDNGPGLADGAVKEGFGLWRARSLTAQVRGTLVVAPGAGGGVRAELRFPL